MTDRLAAGPTEGGALMASLLRGDDPTGGLPTAADVRLRQEVILQLLEEHLPHPIRIDVSIRGDIVTLAGELDNDAEQVRAEAAVRHVAGVRGIIAHWVHWSTRQGRGVPHAQPVAGHPQVTGSPGVEAPAWWLEARAQVLCDEFDRQVREASARPCRNPALPAHPNTGALDAAPGARGAAGSDLPSIAHPSRIK